MRWRRGRRCGRTDGRLLTYRVVGLGYGIVRADKLAIWTLSMIAARARARGVIIAGRLSEGKAGDHIDGV